MNPNAQSGGKTQSFYLPKQKDHCQAELAFMFATATFTVTGCSHLKCNHQNIDLNPHVPSEGKKESFYLPEQKDHCQAELAFMFATATFTITGCSNLKCNNQKTNIESLGTI